MKTQDIATKYGIDKNDFEIYLRRVNAGKIGFSGGVILDDDIEEHVKKYNQQKEAAKQQEEARKKAAEEEDVRKQQALASMLITSGFTFDGYTITKYSGYISGDDCVTIARDNFWNSSKVSEKLCGSLVQIRRQAIKELKEAAYDLGCNAVVGVDFDYLTMDPQHAGALNATITVYEPYVICVTANGNAVVIEKN